jgi:gamma-glutamyltranspeptidase
MTADDLLSHRSVVTEALSCTFRGDEYLSSPPNSQGLFFLAGLRATELLERRLGRQLDAGGADAGTLARVLDQLVGRRDSLLGDPASGPQIVTSLLSDADAADVVEYSLRAVDPAKTRRERHGRPRRPSHLSGDTVAVTVADRGGCWVSLIQSVFHTFGSGILDPATGIILHNRGGSFNLNTGSPNCLGPRRRPLHTLMPVLVRRDGQLVGAHGTMGGRAQPQIHTQVALGVQSLPDPLAAVAAPRWVLGSMDAGENGASLAATVAAESGVGAGALQSLQAAGFTTETLPANDDGAGHVQVVRLIDGGFVSASDPRADGSALAG